MKKLSLRGICLALLAGVALAVPGLANAAPPSGLHVSGNQLLDDANNVVHLHGVNYSGLEYNCIQGYGIFDGPSDPASVQGIASWRSNIVHLMINEDCWLDINGVNPAYAGANYRNAIVNYVNLLHQNGLYAEITLDWAAPGTYKATSAPAAPDADHSPALWSSLAATFANDPNVILGAFGEPVVSFNCLLNGCSNEAKWGGSFYTTAGMQQAVTLMRQAGFTGVIAISGIDYADDLSQWLSYKPSDPLNQLIAEAHVYGNNPCGEIACMDSQLALVAAVVPLFEAEVGETWDDSSCASTNIARILGWADAHGVGYAAWDWDIWGVCGSLISDWVGTPANAYGTWIRDHYLTLPPPLPPPPRFAAACRG